MEWSNTAKSAALFSFFTVFITSVVLFAVSFSTLNPNQVGIRLNKNLYTIDDTRIYNNGRYFLGLGITFITFPISLNQVIYKGAADLSEAGALRAWSKEGQLMDFDLDFWFRLDREHIFNIYNRYGTNYWLTVRRIAVDAIKHVVVRYTAEEFFTSRTAIGKDMKEAVRTRLAAEFFILEMLNLRRVGIPTRFEAKIITKVIQGQLSQTALNVAATNELRAAISVVYGQGNATVSTTLAQASSNATLIVENAKSEGKARLRMQEATSYGLLQSALGLNSTQLLQYRWAQMMGTLEKDLTSQRALKFLVGFQNSVLNL